MFLLFFFPSPLFCFPSLRVFCSSFVLLLMSSVLFIFFPSRPFSFFSPFLFLSSFFLFHSFPFPFSLSSPFLAVPSVALLCPVFTLLPSRRLPLSPSCSVPPQQCQSPPVSVIHQAPVTRTCSYGAITHTFWHLIRGTFMTPQVCCDAYLLRLKTRDPHDSRCCFDSRTC